VLRCGDWRRLSVSEQEDALTRFRRGAFHGPNAFWNVPADGWSSPIEHRKLRAAAEGLCHQGTFGSPRLRRRSMTAAQTTIMSPDEGEAERDRKRQLGKERQTAFRERRRTSGDLGATATPALKTQTNTPVPGAQDMYSLEQIQEVLSSLSNGHPGVQSAEGQQMNFGSEVEVSDVEENTESLRIQKRCSLTAILGDTFQGLREEMASEHRDKMADELASAQSEAADAHQKAAAIEEREKSTCKKAKLSVDSALNIIANLRAEKEFLEERLKSASSEAGAISNLVRHLLAHQGDPAKRTSLYAHFLQSVAPVGANSFQRQVKAELLEYFSSIKNEAPNSKANQALFHRIALGMTEMRAGLERHLPNISGHGRFVDPTSGTLRPFDLAATLAAMSTSAEAIEVCSYNCSFSLLLLTKKLRACTDSGVTLGND